MAEPENEGEITVYYCNFTTYPTSGYAISAYPYLPPLTADDPAAVQPTPWLFIIILCSCEINPCRNNAPNSRAML